MVMYDFFALTEAGSEQQKNNDCFFVNQNVFSEKSYKTSSKKDKFVFGIADGVGSAPHGGEAARYLLERLAKYSRQITHPIILNIIKNAHTYLQKKYTDQAQTVFTVGYIHDKVFTLYHVGDTRAYKLTSKGTLVQLTNDHTYVQKLIDEGVISENMRRTHPQKNIILQSLGNSNYIHIDIYRNTLEAGERLLLTSDGIHDYVLDAEIKKILLSSANLETIANKLISVATSNRSKDDKTALLVKCI